MEKFIINYKTYKHKNKEFMKGDEIYKELIESFKVNEDFNGVQGSCKNKGFLIEHVKPRPNQEMIYAALTGNPNMIRKLKHEWIDNDVIKYALDVSANALLHIPKELITREVCL